MHLRNPEGSDRYGSATRHLHGQSIQLPRNEAEVERLLMRGRMLRARAFHAQWLRSRRRWRRRIRALTGPALQHQTAPPTAHGASPA